MWLTGREKVVKSDSDQKFILEPNAIRYLDQYNIPYPGHGLAHNALEAVEIAERLGYPVVLKIVSSDVVHKSDAGGVIVGVASADQVNECFIQIIDVVRKALPESSIEGVMVCRQAPDGIEVIVGSYSDPVFGPTVMFGIGGIFTEMLGDVAFKIAPLKRIDAEEMVREIRSYPLLTGVRGRPICDLEPLFDLLMAVSRLITENPQIKELDLNPVRIYKSGLMVLDVRIFEQKNPSK
jgi:acyl-CoA synthetase (NDP forming)